MTVLEPNPPQSRFTSPVIKMLLALVLLGVVAGVYVSPLRDRLTIDGARSVVSALRGVWFGPLLFILAYALGVVVCAPASVFIACAGVIWGWKLGAPVALTGAMLGAMASFHVGRYLGGGLLPRFGQKAAAVSHRLERASFRSLLLVRLVPLFPFFVVNYAAGAARVRWADFLTTTLLGIIPAHLIVAYSADQIFNGTLSSGDAFKRLAVVGVLLAALVLLPTLFRKKVEQEMGEG